MRKKVKPSQKLPQEWVEREPKPGLADSHLGDGDVLGFVFTFIPNLITSDTANDHIIGDVVLSAEVLILLLVSTKEVGMGANLTPLVYPLYLRSECHHAVIAWM